MASTILLGTYTKHTSQGIYQTTLKNGELTTPKLVAKIANPTYLRQLDNKIYSVCKDGENGGVAAFNYAKDKLSLINTVTAAEAAPCYIGFNSDKKFVLAANYHAASLKSYAINPDGAINLADTFTHSGSGPRPEQQSAHLHFSDTLFDGTIVACDLGSDSVLLLSLADDGNFSLIHELTMPAGFGPRHIVMAKNHRDAYVVGELSSQVAHLTYDPDNQQFSLHQIYSTIPADFDAHNGAAAIKFSPDERFIYVSNRGHNSLAAFTVQKDGSLNLIQLTSSHGDFPRDFAVITDSQQTYIVCAHQNDGVLALFSQNNDGTLTYQNQTTCPEGVCVCPLN